MKELKKTVYVSDDGKEFASKEDCVQYENNVYDWWEDKVKVIKLDMIDCLSEYGIAVINIANETDKECFEAFIRLVYNEFIERDGFNFYNDYSTKADDLHKSINAIPYGKHIVARGYEWVEVFNTNEISGQILNLVKNLK